MKDKLILPDIAFNATGKCTLQYTDPDTGKVMFETSGNNHVFIKQFTGTQSFQTTALRADLLLCQGGVDPGDDIPVIPGDPIGYGRVNTDGTGLFRGTYRTADSYYNKRSLAKVSNKYVYDFLQNQALGRVDWIGLTSALNYSTNTGAVSAAWEPPHYMNFPHNTNLKAYNCETGDYYYTKVSSSRLYLYYGNTFTDTAERSVNLYSTVGNWYSGTHKVCLDASKNRVYVLMTYKQSSSGSTLNKVLLMTEDLSGVESSADVVSGGSYIGYGAAGGAYNGKLVWLYMQTYSNYRAYVLDLETMKITSVSNVAPGGKNYLKWEEYNCYVYKKFIWYQAYPDGSTLITNDFGDNYFMYGSPLHDMETGELCATVPPGVYMEGTTTYRWRCGLAPYQAYAGQWVCYYNDNSQWPRIHTAYTKYHVPEETPDRPEGMGMTVTYELEIEW